MPPVSTIVRVGAYDLACHDWGGVGDPVVLAHATGFHGVVWRPVAERLVTAGRRVWSFDFRGHGDSDRSREGYAWERFADDVSGLLASLGLASDPRLLTVGHSKGATALLLAEAAQPGLIGRAWCFEPVVIPGDPTAPDPTFPLAVGARRRRATWDTPDDAYRSWAARPPFAALHPDALAAYVEFGLRRRPDGRWDLKCAPTDEAATYAHGPAHGLWTALPAIRATVRVVCGERTDAVPARLAERIAARLEHGSAEVMTGVGHFGPLEDPDAAVASILAFDEATTPPG
ncbi:MAG TPA: alpha/beta hydrolase [Acidimicrobiia bacterium]|nr:alpha/beta hydrolase [Acidimicrobiia bacterium]